jgi:hypothetical protein
LIPFSLTTENGQDMERLLLDYSLICYVKVFLRLWAVLFHRSLKVHQTVNRAEFLKKNKNPLLSEKRILEGRIERKSNVYSLYLHRILLSASVSLQQGFCLFQVQETSKEEEGEAVEEKVKVRFKLLAIKFRFSYFLCGISVLSCPQPRIIILRLGIV